MLWSKIFFHEMVNYFYNSSKSLSIFCPSLNYIPIRAETWHYRLYCTWASKSIVRRKRRAKSPSSIAQSIIISLQVKPEAQASTIPVNWLSKQHGIYTMDEHILLIKTYKCIKKLERFLILVIYLHTMFFL